MVTPELTCFFGMPWVWHVTRRGCLWCLAETERACADFDEAVTRGEYDAHGYTPAERRAQQKKEAVMNEQLTGATVLRAALEQTLGKMKDWCADDRDDPPIDFICEIREDIELILARLLVVQPQPEETKVEYPS